MDRLSGLSWSSPPPAATASKPPPLAPPPPSNAFANLSLRPTPLSSRTTSPAPSATPLNGATTKPSLGAGAAGGDSFSNLVSFGRNKSAGGSLTLQEQQKKLQEQKMKEEAERQKKMDALFGGSSAGNGNPNAGFWNSLESGKPTNSASVSPAPPAQDEDDILSAFNSAAPVDNSSHYPPPSSSSFQTTTNNDIPTHRNGTPSFQLQDLMDIPVTKTKSSSSLDPFDVENLQSFDASSMSERGVPSATPMDDDDDILGDLGKPVSEFPSRREPTPQIKIEEPPSVESPSQSSDPRDPAIAALVEMGFSVTQAKKALSETDTGLDVEGAINWLMEQAHKTSSRASSNNESRAASRQGRHERHEVGSSSKRRREDSENSSRAPAWAREGRGREQGEKDLGAYATEIGGTLFKSANNLWNTSRKKVGKAIAELQNDGDGGDPGMPKWMREQQVRDQMEERGEQKNRFGEDEKISVQRKENPQEITDEAMMLEAGTGPLPRRKKQQQRGREERSEQVSSPFSGSVGEERIQRERRQELESAIRQKEQEMRQRQQARHTPSIPNSTERREKLTRGAADEDSAVQYVSRNRRRPPPSAPISSASSSKPATSEPDLLSTGETQSRNPFHQPRQQFQKPAPSPSPPPPQQVPTIIRRQTPQRPNIPLSPSSLQSSNSYRKKGSEFFKCGDFTQALTNYTFSLAPLPESHLLRIVVLSNRSLCNLKLGDSKAALVDADEAITIIGSNRGEGETVNIDGSEKDMKEFWCKAMMRKAEALEAGEKWADAAKTWQETVEAGMGGAVTISGKRRCENVSKPKPTSTAPAAARRPPPLSSSRQKPASATSGDAVAVNRLRAFNAAQEKAVAEKHALHDSVESRINTWKAGKEGNLRALLASLDTVLWEGSGWKKVGMGELVMPNKCKIYYMKGIGKTHPDKIPTDATTEQRMISGAVFNLLNQAWDKFKVDNGL